MRLKLLEGFELRCDDEVVALPTSAQRLVAFLALHERPLRRAYVAGTLWIDTTEKRAAANLRSALWRLTRPGRPLISISPSLVSVAPGVDIDVRDVVSIARWLLKEPDGTEMPGAVAEPETELLSADLLPDWYDEWVIVERERLRHLRLHALEALCRRLTAAGQVVQAIEAGLAAVAAEPLRESAHRALIAAHISEGNRDEALRQYKSYRVVLRRELGIEPSPHMERLVHDLGLASPMSERPVETR